LKRRIKVEVEDGEGSKLTLTLEGKLTKDKVIKFMDFLEEITSKEEVALPSTDTSFGKVWRLIEEKFSLGSFETSEILEAYEDTYKETIKLSTLSTYLARLVDKGYLTRRKMGNSWIYKKANIKSISV